jgi:hypothetical protein
VGREAITTKTPPSKAALGLRGRRIPERASAGVLGRLTPDRRLSDLLFIEDLMMALTEVGRFPIDHANPIGFLRAGAATSAVRLTEIEPPLVLTKIRGNTKTSHLLSCSLLEGRRPYERAFSSWRLGGSGAKFPLGNAVEDVCGGL